MLISTKLQEQKGQALLIVVLVMVVALTVTLSVVSRSIVNLKTSVDQSDSQQALSAAEKAIQNAQVAIKSGVTPIPEGGFLATNTSFKTATSPVGGSTPFMINGGADTVAKDNGSYVWLSHYNQDHPFSDTWSGTLDIYWGDSSDTTDVSCKNNNAALEIVVISGNRTTPTLTRYAYDPCVDRAGKNNFITSGSEFSAVSTPIRNQKDDKDYTFYFKAEIPITNGFLAKVVPLYKAVYVGAGSKDGSPPLPKQGDLISTTGFKGSGSLLSSHVERKVVVYQGYSELPVEYFPFNILVPSNSSD